MPSWRSLSEQISLELGGARGVKREDLVFGHLPQPLAERRFGQEDCLALVVVDDLTQSDQLVGVVRVVL